MYAFNWNNSAFNRFGNSCSSHLQQQDIHWSETWKWKIEIKKAKIIAKKATLYYKVQLLLYPTEKIQIHLRILWTFLNRPVRIKSSQNLSQLDHDWRSAKPFEYQTKIVEYWKDKLNIHREVKIDDKLSNFFIYNVTQKFRLLPLEDSCLRACSGKKRFSTSFVIVDYCLFKMWRTCHDFESSINYIR